MAHDPAPRPADHPVVALGGRQIDAGAAADGTGTRRCAFRSRPPRAQPRPGEVDGREYYFHAARRVSRRWSPTGEMLEHAEVFGNLYGTPARAGRGGDGRGARHAVRHRLAGRPADPQLGAAASDVVSIFILPPSIAELERRLRARGQDSAEVIAGRMAKSRDEISHWAEYDYVLVNDDLDRAEAELEDHPRRRTAAPRPPAAACPISSAA